MNDKNKLVADAVFEGGGVKGIGLVGAVAVAEEKGYRWSNLAGTSAGAIVAALLAAGYTGAELKEIIGALDYNRFKDAAFLSRMPLVGRLASLFFKKGIYEGDYFQRWITGLLKHKNVETFGDLIIEEFKDDPRYRYKLNVIASDITRGRLLVLPRDAADFGVNPEDLNVAFAVRMSMSIPFFYNPVTLKNMKTNEDSFIVDGGVLSNFPVWLFDTKGSVPEWPTLGFKLVEPDHGKSRRIKGPVSLFAALFSTMMEAHDARYITEANFVRTIPIPTLGVNTTEFGISRAKSEALYQSGRAAGEKFFASWSFEDYVEKYRKGAPDVSRGDRLRKAGAPR